MGISRREKAGGPSRVLVREWYVRSVCRLGLPDVMTVGRSDVIGTFRSFYTPVSQLRVTVCPAAQYAVLQASVKVSETGEISTASQTFKPL